MAEEHDSPATEPQDAPGGPSASMIVTAEGLSTALKTAAPGSTIQLEKNTEYVVDEPLHVPDGVTLKGKGEMQFDKGLPDQFRPGTATTITANDNLAGNLLTLGNGSSVQRLVLKGATPPQEDDAGHVPETYAGRFGNVVAVASRRKNDIVSAAIKECELINKYDAGGVPAGPTGGAILAHTHNPEDDPPHEDAEVTVEVAESIIHAPNGGKALFAMNFASGGKVSIKLKRNKVGGSLDVIGGLARPDAVVDATTTIDSHGNLYQPSEESDATAWQIIGGSFRPIKPDPKANSDSNSVNVISKGDQIEGFQVGIAAVGGQRHSTDGGTCSYNEVNLKLLRMTLVTNAPGETKPPEAAADFVFVGALSADLFSAGDANIVHVHVQQTTGSGRRENLYADSAGFGTGNQLVFKGTPAAFTRSNHDIEPAPPAEFFEHGG